jgi:hypothetical protein
MIWHEEWLIQREINKQTIIDGLKDFELSNVIRLGLVKEEKEFYTEPQTLEIPNERRDYDSYTNVKIDIDMVSEINHVLTELGSLFLTACREKSLQ